MSCALEESPWGDMRGKELDPRRLANLLKQYGIKSETIRIGESTPKGYTRESLYDAWTRYCGPSDIAATSATAQQSIAGADSSVADKSSVADRSATNGHGEKAEPSEGNGSKCGGRQAQHDTQAQHSNLGVPRVVADVADVADLQGMGEKDISQDDPREKCDEARI